MTDFYYGEYTHLLDGQCRVSLPSEWRRRDGETELVMIPSAERALLLLPPAMLEDFFARMRNATVTSAPIQRALAEFGRNCRACRCDRQGRMALDRKMLSNIGVDNQLKLVGAVTHIRLCAPQEMPEITPETLAGSIAALDQVNNSLDPALSAILRSVRGDK